MLTARPTISWTVSPERQLYDRVVSAGEMPAHRPACARTVAVVPASTCGAERRSPVHSPTPHAATPRGANGGPADQWAVTGSNRRPPACKAGALPAELTAQVKPRVHPPPSVAFRARPPRPRIETRNRKRSSWPRSGRISFGDDAPSGIRTRATTLKGWRPRPLVDGGGRAQNSREPHLHWPGGPVAQLVEQGTFNPKVTGSIPVRPTPLQLVGKRLHDSVCSLRSKRSALLGNSQATEAHRLTKGSVPPAPSVGHRSRLDRRADSTGAGKIETAVRE
jgi:hypothetical protein